MISSPLSRSLISLLRFRRPISPRSNAPLRFFSASDSNKPRTRLTNPTASFDWSDDESDAKSSAPEPKPKPDKLPPPYDPFNKNKPSTATPSDPSNLQQVFHDMRKDGLFDSAVRMFDGLSKDGLTHEALELFRLIQDKSTMPDVVAHTAVIEAYANAGGHWKEAVRTYEKMLASGVLPNAYTYAVLIKGMAKDGRVGEARKYALEMMGKGMRPNVETYAAVLEAFVREGKVEEGGRLVEEMKGKGMVFDEKRVREVVGKRGHVYRSIMGMLFNK